jgi:Ni,Fe-hydrogenase I cytochrome b subunit
MRRRHVLLVAMWIAMLAWYGWLKVVALLTLVAAGLFFGTMFLFALYDAIRTRASRASRLHAAPDDDELRQLRHMAGLEK